MSLKPNPTLPLEAALLKPKLLDQVRSVLRARHYSMRTEQAYLDWIRRFIAFYARREPAAEGVERQAGPRKSFAHAVFLQGNSVK